jgi:hypothetical protein
MWPVRQIEIYDAGPVLLYGPDLVEDVHGGLGEAALGEIDEWSEWDFGNRVWPDLEAVWLVATPDDARAIR